MLSKDLEFSINLAFREARDRRHEFMTIEHLLLALLEQENGSGVLSGLGVDKQAAETHINELLAEIVASL